MYELIARYVMNTPWAIVPEKLDVMLGILAIRMAGGQVAPEEIAAAMNGRRNEGARQAGSIAVLPLYGTVAHRMDMMVESSGGTSTVQFSKALRGALADNQVSGIVIDIDSPGGSADGVPELAREIWQARQTKPIVGVANSLAASAAYWIGSAASELWAAPSAEVGSIGVWAAHQDMTAYYEREGIKTTLVRAGKYKAETNPYEPLTDDARAYLQTRVDEAYDMFVADVAKQRGVSRDTVRGGFGEGRVVTARKAKELGMVDRVGTLDEAIERAAGLAWQGARERSRAADDVVRARIAGV